jgi:hypothetical protein
MRNLFSTLTACCLSILLYLVLFGFVLARPLVIDEMATLIDHKLSYARAAHDPKLFIIAASNARFSHSCAVLEERLGRPCVNAGIAGGIGLDWVIDKFRPTIHRGDLVYLPVEYPTYGFSRAELYTGADAAYRFRHEKRGLWIRGFEGLIRAAFVFDLPVMIHSLGEMALQASNFHRRLGVSTEDPQGDEIGHNDEQAAVYEASVGSLPFAPPAADQLFDNPDGELSVLAKFLDWCRNNGVEAVGGLPTTFDDVRIPDGVVDRLREFYVRHGAEFVELSNRSQYPRRDFFDSPYHLRERIQKLHSQLLAEVLQPLLPK